MASLCLPWQAVQAQVSVTATLGVPVGNYATLLAAFNAVNNGIHQGAVAITIVGDITEFAPAMLFASGGIANYSSVTITPNGLRAVSGSMPAGTALVQLNGADNVTIDGLNSGGNSLTFTNTFSSIVAGSGTIKLFNDATNNLIKRCTILGASTVPLGTEGGTVVIGNGGGVTGNDNNTVDDCNIGPSGALPTKGVFLGGTSNAHPGAGNSGNSVINCRIADFFSSTFSSAGLDIVSGTVNGTFNNNRFYQTGTRAHVTLGITHRAISLNNTAGSGYQVRHNIIGYASATASGTYTLNFPLTATNSFHPIYLNVGGASVTNIWDNTIAGIAIGGGASGVGDATPFSAIYVNDGWTEVELNTIGSQATTGSITFTSNFAGNCDLNGIYCTVPFGWYTRLNTIGGITVNNTDIGWVRFYGIHANIPEGYLFTSNQNTVGGTVANSIQNLSIAASSVTVGIYNPAATAYIVGTTVRNLTASGGQFTGATSGITGILCPTTTAFGSTLSQNTITNLRSTVNGMARVQGIYFSGSLGNSNNQISANQIYDLDAGHSTASLFGIVAQSGSGRFDHNVVRLGVVGNSGTMGMAIVGMFDNVGTSNNFYYNSVYIGGAPTSGNQKTYAFRSVPTETTRNYLNNIFFNGRSNAGSTGTHYAIQVNSNFTPAPELACNYNILRASGIGGVLGEYISGDIPTLAAWRTSTGKDWNSLGLDPNFAAPTAIPADLHLANPTPAEGTGVPIPGFSDIAYDIDGVARSIQTPEDIGADAGNFIQIDVTPPSYVITTQPFVCSQVPLFVTAYITDASGIPQTGSGVPHLYWRINAGAWQSVAGIYNPVTFNFGFTFGAGAMPSDLVYYYLVARDQAPLPNVGTWPVAGSSGYSYDPPAAAVPPSPFGHAVSQVLSGTYTVGAGGNFPSLATAINAYNTACLNGPVVFSLTAPTYNEANLSINQNLQASSTNTLTIKPALGNSPTITGVGTTAIFYLNGADWVTIDGYAGNLGPITNSCCPLVRAPRNMVLFNNIGSSSSAVVWLGNGAQNNVIRNCTIRGQSSANTLCGIGTGTVPPSLNLLGVDVDNNTIENNEIHTVQHGILSMGTDADKNEGNRILLNEMVNAITPIGFAGILLGNHNNVEVSCNSISNISHATGRDAIGIGLGFGPGVIAANTPGSREVTNATITQNTIGGVVQNAAQSAIGIAYGASIGGNTVIANNVIHGVRSNPTGTEFSAGILLNAGTASNVRVLHNTVSMQGTITGGIVATSGAHCLAVSSVSVAGIELHNNIFSNTQVGNGSNTLKLSALAFAGTDLTGLVSNHNDLYSTGPAPGVHSIALLGGVTNGSWVDPLSSWQSTYGKDLNSVSAAPSFISTTDLHLNATSHSNITYLMSGGTTTSITNDMDCAPRSFPSPTIGADDFLVPACSVAPLAGTSSGPTTSCAWLQQTYTNNAVNAISGVTYGWFVSTTSPAGPWTQPSGTGVNTQSYTTDELVVGTYYLVMSAKCLAAADSTLTNVITLVVHPIPSVNAFFPSGPIICGNGAKQIVATSSVPNSTYIWSPGGSTGTPITVSPPISTIYTVIGTTPAGCSSTAMATVIVNLGVTASTVATPGSICVGSSTTLTTTVSPVDYSINASSGAISVAVPDGSLTGASVPLVLNGGSGVVREATTISVTLSINTTNNADVDAYLVGPGNCGVMELTTDNGSTGDNYLTTVFTTPYVGFWISTVTMPTNNITGTWMPEGTVTTTPVLNTGMGGGSYAIPTTSLGGCPVNGTWTLFVGDDAVGNVSTITKFELTIHDEVGGDYGINLSGGIGNTNFGPMVYSGANNSVGSRTATPISPGTYTYTFTTFAPSGCTTTSTASVIVTPCTGTVSARVLLEGPYDAGTGLMSDALRSLPGFPLTEPYTALGFVHAGGGGGETIAPAVLAVSGANAIVDWVLLEFRDATTPATVHVTRSALVQRDGDVVGLDGVSPVVLLAGGYAGDYVGFIALRHRNHLGVMTANAFTLGGAPVSIDFSNPALPTYGTNARKSTIDGKLALWPGNVNPDDQVKYLGAGDDRDMVLGAIGGTVLTTVLNNVYHQADVTMNGEVKYLGAGDDRDPILNTIGGVILNSIRLEQLP